MNKKGFTLIEIIICISLLAVLGTISIVSAKKREENDYTELNKNLAEAASVYLSVEKDEQGNTYETGLLSGGTGVFIPIDDLYNKGYIDDNTLKTLEKNNEYNEAKNNNKSLYLLASIYSEDSDECSGEVAIEYKNSWDNVRETIYLCPYSITKKAKENISITSLIDNLNYIVDMNKAVVSKNHYDRITEEIETKDSYGNDIKINKKDYFTYDESGLFFNWNQDGYSFNDSSNSTADGIVNNYYYYYRGNVENNYLYFGEKDGKKLKWRILWIDKDNRMKILLNEEVPIVLKNKIGDKYIVQKDDVFTFFEYVHKSIQLEGATTYSSSSDVNYWFKNLKCDNVYCLDNGSCKIDGSFYQSNCEYNTEDLFIQGDNYSNGNLKLASITSVDNIFNKTMKNWYDSTNLATITDNTIIKNNNVCSNALWAGYYNNQVEINNQYECLSGGNYYNNDNFYQYIKRENYQSVSDNGLFLNYPELKRAGIYRNKNNFGYSVIDSGSFMLNKKTNGYILNDIYYTKTGRPTTEQYYYLDDSGLNVGEIYYNNYIGFTDGGYANTEYILKSNSNAINVNNFRYNDDSWHYYVKHLITFKANTVKPALLLNISDVELSGDGTEAKPYEFVK